MAHQYETRRPIYDRDFARDYRDWSIDLVTNSSNHNKIFDMDAVGGHITRARWHHVHVFGDTDRTDSLISLHKFTCE